MARESPHSVWRCMAIVVTLAGIGHAHAAGETDLTGMQLEQLLNVTVVSASKYVQTQREVAAAASNWTVLPDGRMEACAQLLRLFGMPVVLGDVSYAHTFLEMVLEEDLESVRRARAHLLEDGTPYQLTFRVRRHDGAVRTFYEQAAPLEGSPGEPTRIEGITQDITERVQAEERIQQLAHFDPVTGLPNRKFFAELAGPALERAARIGVRRRRLRQCIKLFHT